VYELRRIRCSKALSRRIIGSAPYSPTCGSSKPTAAASITRARAIAVYHFSARGTPRRLNALLPPPIPSSAASVCERAFSPRAFAGSYSGHGSCVGALAEVFGQRATLTLTIRQAMNGSRPIRSNRSSATGGSFDSRRSAKEQPPNEGSRPMLLPPTGHNGLMRSRTAHARRSLYHERDCYGLRAVATAAAQITSWPYGTATNQILSGLVPSRKIYTCGRDQRHFPTVTFNCNSAIGTRTRTSVVRSRTACPAFAIRRSRQTAFRGNLARDRQHTSTEFCCRRYDAFCE
jgi:hypothetical protein